MPTPLLPHDLGAANGAIVDLDSLLIQKFPIQPSGENDQGPFSAKQLDATRDLPEVVIYEHINYGGASERTNLNWYHVGDFWNDKISSIVVVRGTWRFYKHVHYQGLYWDLSEGYYNWVKNVGMPNDIISSFRVL